MIPDSFQLSTLECATHIYSEYLCVVTNCEHVWLWNLIIFLCQVNEPDYFQYLSERPMGDGLFYCYRWLLVCFKRGELISVSVLYVAIMTSPAVVL